MNDNVRLEFFITFILLAGVPNRRSAAIRDLIDRRPAIPNLLPLTRFLKAVIARARASELSARKPIDGALVFRIGQPE